MLKRILSSLLALALCLTPVISLADTVEPGPEIEIWAGYVRDYSEVTKVQEQWKELLGFNTRIKNVTGDVSTALNLALASGGFKDIAVLPLNSTYNTSIIRSGSVMNVSDILKDERYPNIASIPQQYLDISADADGQYWYIPSEWDVNPDDPWPGWTRKAFMISDDVLSQVGMKAEDIKTLADYEKFLRAAKNVKNAQGENYIPATYSDVETVLTNFGVKTGQAGGSVISVEKRGDEFVFLYDQENYKAAFAWLNKMIREGLIDEESVIQKSDIRKEKLYSGKYASIIGYEDFNATEEGDPYRSFNPIPFPLAEGVEAPGIQFIINPYPKTAIYISKNTENLDAILEFLNWALEPVAERHMELNEGLVGHNWNWVDQPYGAWKFNEDYEAERNNPATRANLQPEMYMMGTVSRVWYPWWTKEQPADAAQYVHVRHNDTIFTYGTHENIHSWDNVKAEAGSKWEKYGPTLTQIKDEYTAKLLLAKDDAEFDAVWNEFRDTLETKGHWEELKEEWYVLYANQTSVTGQW